MRLDRALTLHVSQRYLRVLNSPRGDIPVLMYHSISDDPEPGVSPYFRTSTSPARFAQQMQWLDELGYRGVSVEEALEKGGLKNCPHLAAITFDDGFRDFQLAAWEVLQRHGFSATVYLPTAFISDERKIWNRRECLSWKEVRQLQREGARFGSHSVSHRVLYGLSWYEIQSELKESKAQMEQELGTSVPSFAYPFAFPQEDGGFTQRFKATAQELGYQSCATTVVGSYQPGRDRFLLKRLPVNECDDRELFGAKLAGAYNWMSVPQFLVRRMKSWKR